MLAALRLILFAALFTAFGFLRQGPILVKDQPLMSMEKEKNTLGGGAAVMNIDRNRQEYQYP
jgi:hypothetical protein